MNFRWNWIITKSGRPVRILLALLLLVSAISQIPPGQPTIGLPTAQAAQQPILAVTPYSSYVGNVMFVSGSGYAPNLAYAVNVTRIQFSGSIPVLTFTTTTTGTIPLGAQFVVPELATNLENGSLATVTVSPIGEGGSLTTMTTVLIRARAWLNVSNGYSSQASRAAGQAVTISAHGLNSGAVYNVILNWSRAGNSYLGIIVRVIVPDASGMGSTSFTIPKWFGDGAYLVQLVVSSQGPKGLPPNQGVLLEPLTVIVGNLSATSISSTATTTTATTATRTLTSTATSSTTVTEIATITPNPLTTTVTQVVARSSTSPGVLDQGEALIVATVMVVVSVLVALRIRKR